MPSLDAETEAARMPTVMLRPHWGPLLRKAKIMLPVGGPRGIVYDALTAAGTERGFRQEADPVRHEQHGRPPRRRPYQRVARMEGAGAVSLQWEFIQFVWDAYGGKRGSLLGRPSHGMLGETG